MRSKSLKKRRVAVADKEAVETAHERIHIIERRCLEMFIYPCPEVQAERLCIIEPVTEVQKIGIGSTVCVTAAETVFEYNVIVIIEVGCVVGELCLRGKQGEVPFVRLVYQGSRIIVCGRAACIRGAMQCLIALR